MSAVAILVDATIVICAVVAGAGLARRSRAAVRHAWLAAAFAVLMALPFASMALPTVRIALPAAVRPMMGAGLIAPGDNSAAPTDAALADSRPDQPSAERRPLSAAALLLLVWFGGVAVSLVPVAAGVWQVRRLRRNARPWRRGRAYRRSVDGSARHIQVLVHDTLPGPMTCGIFRPAIVFPADADTWPDDDLKRAIVHELEHVRRADWLSHCLARVVTACYWFHPIVWMAWRRLALEAERACDDAVLLATAVEADQSIPASDDPAAAYADQLVGTARRLSAAARPLQLAMADQRDLSRRIAAVLDRRQVRGRAGARRVLIVVASAVVVIAGLSSIRMDASASEPHASDTRAAAQRLTYDAATIKPCQAEEHPTGARGTAGGTNATISPGRFYVPCVTTEQLIYLAYAAHGAGQDEHLVNDDYGEASNTTKVRGGPDWVHSLKDKYEIEATAAGATERTVLMGAMLRSLLEDRFHLKVHRETEEAPLDELVVAPGGLKLTPMHEGDCIPYDGSPVDFNAAKPTCGNLMMTGDAGKTVWTFGGFALSGLATSLGRTLHTHVVDKTGVTDKFIFRFEFTRGADDFATEASMSAALEQLGLKLVHTKGPRGYLVIDHIERPTPDGPFESVPPARMEGPGSAGRTPGRAR
jgi:uncharacterized protein (TIGR03435 family)